MNDLVIKTATFNGKIQETLIKPHPNNQQKQNRGN